MKKLILIIASILLCGLTSFSQQYIRAFEIDAYQKLETKRAFVIDLDTFYATTQLDGTDTILVSKKYLHSRISNMAYDASWNGKDSIAPTQNSVYDKISTMEAVDYCPTSTTVNRGTITGGSVSNLCAKDGNTLVVTEGAGADPLRITFSFSNVQRMSYFIFYGAYSGGASHILYAEIYNPNTTSWDYVGQFGLDNNAHWHSFPIYLPSSYISAGNVQIRINHQTAGNPLHYLTLDYVDVNFGGGGGGVAETASEITFTPSGNLSSTNVQNALIELDNEKLSDAQVRAIVGDSVFATEWNAAYNDKITAIGVSGTDTKTITLTQQDGGTLTANFTDISGEGGGAQTLSADSTSTTIGITISGTNSRVHFNVDKSATNEIEVVDETYNATNFNGGSTTAVSQDDFYDYNHLADTDDDGYVNKVDLASAGFVKTDAGGNITVDGSTYLTAEVDGSTTNELNTSMGWDNATNTVSVVDAGGTKSVVITGFLESEVDGSITNEGSLSVGAGTGTSSIINSNTSGSTGVTVNVGTGLSISETASSITLTNSSPNVTTNLSITGTTSPLTLNSSDGTDVTVTAGTGISLAGTSGNITITNTAPNADQTITLSGDVSGTGTTAITTAVADDSHNHTTTTLPNLVSSVDGVINDGGDIDLLQSGIVTISPNDADNTITISATEVDGSVTNEIQDLSLSGNTLSLTGDATPVDLSTFVNPDLSGYQQDSDTLTWDATASDLTTGLASREPANANIQQHITNDADLSITNEIQTLSTSGAAGNITISSGNTINISVDDHSNRTALNAVSGTNTGDQDLTPYQQKTDTLTWDASAYDLTIGLAGKENTLTKGNLTETVTGLQFSATRQVIGGAATLSMTAGYVIPTTTEQTNWGTAYTERYQWDGGATNLVAATGRTSLGATTIGGNIFTSTNPSAITFLRANADNTVTWLDAASFRTAIGAGTSSTTGTVTSVTAGDGMTQTGTSTINPTLNVVSHAGTAGTIGTLNVSADALGVNLGVSSTTAYRGDYGNAAYNGRISSFTTTGNSGAATFSSNVLNIPNYTLAGLGYTVPTLQQVVTAGATSTLDITVPAETYGAGWNGSNEVPTKNDVYDKVETLVSSSASNSKTVSQTAHGFSVGNWIYLNGSTYAKAIASAHATADVIGVVSNVADANNFTYQFAGVLPGAYTAGQEYYLSVTTAGAAGTEPSYTEGQVRQFLGTGLTDGSLLIEIDIGLKITDPLTGATLPSGSPSYIWNGTTPQTASFSISGSGVIGGNLTVAGAGGTDIMLEKARVGQSDPRAFVIRTQSGDAVDDYVELWSPQGRDMRWYGGSNIFNNLVYAPRFESTVATGTAPFTVASTTLNTNLNADRVDNYHVDDIMPYQSINDFTNGTLVTTNIDASTSEGPSYILELTGKAYSGNLPLKVVVEGYLYGNTIWAPSALSYGGSFSSSIKILEYNGKLCFWWPRMGYWQSFRVSVYVTSEGNSNKSNRVISITDEVEPTSSKKATVSVHQVYHTNNFNPANYTPTSRTLTINGTGYDLSADRSWTVTANTPNSLTMNNSGSGDASGSTFNGSAAKTISYNSIGAAPADYPATLGTDHTYLGTTVTGTAGENLVFGDFVYFKWSDGKWWKASASAYATARTRGVVVETINSAASGKILIDGMVRDDTWNWTAAEVWLSTTSGTGTSTQPSTTGNQIQFLGTALSADLMLFKPSQDIGEK